MDLIPVQDAAKAPAERFTGDVYVTPINQAQPPSRLVAALVRFTPGARTNWHSHAVGLGGPSGVTAEVAAMQYTRLGRSGLKVSRRRLGCMSYGQAAAGMHQWTLDEDAAAPFFRQAVELGVTFWDTANVYQGGTSEEFVGRAIHRYSRREDIVLATKVTGRCTTAPAAADCPARPSWSSSTRRCAGWAPTTSTCTTSTGSMTRCRSRRPWRPCTTWSRPGRCAT